LQGHVLLLEHAGQNFGSLDDRARRSSTKPEASPGRQPSECHRRGSTNLIPVRDCPIRITLHPVAVRDARWQPADLARPRSRRWCTIVTQTTELNRASSNGSAVASPPTTSTLPHERVCSRAPLVLVTGRFDGRDPRSNAGQPQGRRATPWSQLQEIVAEGDGGQRVGRRLSRISFPTSCWRNSSMDLIHSAIHRRWHPARCDGSNRDVPLRRQA
jgi:hypothetical protein